MLETSNSLINEGTIFEKVLRNAGLAKEYIVKSICLQIMLQILLEVIIKRHLDKYDVCNNPDIFLGSLKNN